MIDIIMATYNGARYIAEQIRSILGSDEKDIRVLVYDDMSEDETPDIVKSFADKAPGKVFCFKNEIRYGHCANFLQGLKKAVREYPAEYYMFSDQDDLWLKDKISLCLARIRSLETNTADRSVDEESRTAKRSSEGVSSCTPCMVFTDAILVNADAEPTGMTFIKADRLDASKTDLAHLLMENKCQGCTMMINNALAGMIGSYDERVRYHDWWIALIASAFGRIGFIDTPTLMHRQHEDNAVGQGSFTDYLRGRLHSGRKDARERLKATFDQAAAFYKYYGRQLRRKDRMIVRAFLKLKDMNAVGKRVALLRYGYLKSGPARNAGLMMYI
ncbi:MAG: glycosyltransferase family 2 protein [Lachnospiraceae bacterium]|nr:glycosyltransferase family 2 protein [Lachnospiraceae bacterium]